MLSSNVTSLFLCFAGSFRNDGLKAADVLPILKEKVAFVSGEHISLIPAAHHEHCLPHPGPYDAAESQVTDFMFELGNT